jgi:hypothetical protein
MSFAIFDIISMRWISEKHSQPALFIRLKIQIHLPCNIYVRMAHNDNFIGADYT